MELEGRKENGKGKWRFQPHPHGEKWEASMELGVRIRDKEMNGGDVVDVG